MAEAGGRKGATVTPGRQGRAAVGAERFERQSPQDVVGQGDGVPRMCPEGVQGWFCQGRKWLIPDRQLGAGVGAEDGV